MIRFALIVASVLGFALTTAVGNLLVPLLRTLVPPEKEAERRPGRQQPERQPSEPRGLPTMGGLCFIIGTLAAVGVGWVVVCLVQPELLGGGLTGRLMLGLGAGFLFGAAGLADDLARLRPRQVLGLRTGARLVLEGAAALITVAALFLNGSMPTGLTLPAPAIGSWALPRRRCGPSCWWPSANRPGCPVPPTAQWPARPLWPCWPDGGPKPSWAFSRWQSCRRLWPGR